MNYNKRKEQRFPGIRLSVLFSPLTGSNVTKLAESYLQANSHDISVSGMSFDVTVALQPDSTLMVSVPDGHDSSDELMAVVRWCKKISEDHYRVGVVFDIAAGIKKPTIETDFVPVLHGPGIPVEATLVCPACLALTNFIYKGMQGGCGQEGGLPLYNCGACDSTRSITSLLSFNRNLRRSDDA